MNKHEAESYVMGVSNFQQRILNLTHRYLAPRGWLNPEPKDCDGNYLPWFTYPCISFLDDILDPTWRVFEYGGGYSTLYFLNNVTEVETVESNKDWVTKLKDMDPRALVEFIPQNIVRNTDPDASTLIEEFKARNFNLPKSTSYEHDFYHGLINEGFDAYAAHIASKPKGYYDVVLVDGMARSLCAYFAAEYVKEDGYIIFDNADRWQYNDVYQHLIDQGFARIDFWGTGPTNPWEWTTSIFSRNFKIKNRKLAREPNDKPCI